MALLDGLLFTGRAREEPISETRGGLPLFNGAVHSFAEWKFRVLDKTLVVEKSKVEDREWNMAELYSQVSTA